MSRRKTVFECYSIPKIVNLGPKKPINKLGYAQPKLGTSFGFLGPLEFGF